MGFGPHKAFRQSFSSTRKGGAADKYYMEFYAIRHVDDDDDDDDEGGGAYKRYHHMSFLCGLAVFSIRVSLQIILILLTIGNARQRFGRSLCSLCALHP